MLRFLKGTIPKGRFSANVINPQLSVPSKQFSSSLLGDDEYVDGPNGDILTNRLRNELNHINHVKSNLVDLNKIKASMNDATNREMVWNEDELEANKNNLMPSTGVCVDRVV